ncbi:radical SAM protein [Pelotomaculum terephthalicicum JT]|uniref:radical SAM protein n=1 Tax=Pelotomaculum terephthalicicum TaxID=206393 RepID=UPI0009D11FD1|nr:radical SAM protein [Pelotomaculum terephthalicicum]MCG9967836.1 radical SAM protein [Pelotomaculum terephthalicicum JT]OPY62370.1 MAG: coproporphyrinogen III oxidase [Pelotomaculum sp. PtaU1.Bin065]
MGYYLVPPVYRPPSEAASLIFQVTLGCSHNACSFCVSYKGKRFRVKTWEEIEADIDAAKVPYRNITRVFLADGNAMVAETGLLLKVLEKLYRDFPYLERVGIYARASDFLSKTPEDLKKLREAGITLAYLGLESGSDHILNKMIHKGSTAAEIIEGGRKAMEAGLPLSVTVIIGVGGPELSEEHARATAEAASAINPAYLSALTMLIPENSFMDRKVKKGEFKLLTPEQSLQELRVMLENMTLTNCVFRSNHASNYLPLKGVLNQDKEKLVALIQKALAHPELLRPEFLRAL